MTHPTFMCGRCEQPSTFHVQAHPHGLVLQCRTCGLRYTQPASVWARDPPLPCGHAIAPGRP